MKRGTVVRHVTGEGPLMVVLSRDTSCNVEAYYVAYWDKWNVRHEQSGVEAIELVEAEKGAES